MKDSSVSSLFLFHSSWLHCLTFSFDEFSFLRRGNENWESKRRKRKCAFIVLFSFVFPFILSDRRQHFFFFFAQIACILCVATFFLCRLLFLTNYCERIHHQERCSLHWNEHFICCRLLSLEYNFNVDNFNLTLRSTLEYYPEYVLLLFIIVYILIHSQQQQQPQTTAMTNDAWENTKLQIKVWQWAERDDGKWWNTMRDIKKERESERETEQKEWKYFKIPENLRIFSHFNHFDFGFIVLSFFFDVIFSGLRRV